MEREVRNRNHYHTRGSGGHNNNSNKGLKEPDLVPQWGSRKRLRCVKVHRRDDTEKATIGRALRKKLA